MLNDSASYVWRSILWGRDLLCKGLRRRIGNGRSTSVFSDPWLPRPTTFKPLTALSCSLQVADLIDQQRNCWNAQKLNEFLIPEDVALVSSIPLPLSPLDDGWLWHYDRQGCYTVKSGYNLAISTRSQASSSNPSSNQSWWKLLWHLKIPPKIRIFIWRSCWDALPTALNLFYRKIVSSGVCCQCGMALETVFHALVACKLPKKVWRLSEFMNMTPGNLSGSIDALLKAVYDAKGTEGLSWACVVLLCLWNA